MQKHSATKASQRPRTQTKYHTEDDDTADRKGIILVDGERLARLTAHLVCGALWTRHARQFSQPSAPVLSRTVAAVVNWLSCQVVEMD